jgi:hypothetical protein
MGDREASIQLRRLAKQLQAVASGLTSDAMAAELDARLDETARLLASTSIDRALDVDAELAAMADTVEAWRVDLGETAHHAAERRAMRELACAWADRFMWIAGLFEATDE